MSKPKEVFDRVQSMVRAKNDAAFDAAIGTDSNLCICTNCGWPDTGEAFTAPTGGDDYYGDCPNCHAGEDHFIDLRD